MTKNYAQKARVVFIGRNIRFIDTKNAKGWRKCAPKYCDIFVNMNFLLDCSIFAKNSSDKLPRLR